MSRPTKNWNFSSNGIRLCECHNEEMLKYENCRFDENRNKQQYYWRCAVKNREWHNRKRSERRETGNLYPSEQYERQRALRLAKYGITIEDYEKLLVSQNGVCAICSGEPDTRWKILAVDHCHKTGKVRGLLCMTCNTMIGRLEKRMEETLKYLGVK